MATADEAERCQFDFWLGDWNLTWGEGQSGSNHIRAILDGKVIEERFDGEPSIPLKGMSVSTFDAELGNWRQTWVDNEGSYIDLIGTFNSIENQMVLVSNRQVNGVKGTYRMVFHNILADSLEWRWEVFDAQQGWQPRWEIHYQRQRS